MRFFLLCIWPLLFFSHCNKREVPKPKPVEPFKPDVNIGAYYFGGWYENSHHVTDALKTSYPERTPIWGWVTSTPDIIKAQIDSAANAGLTFFSFCWYFNTDLSENKGANIAIQQYLAAPNKNRLKFCYLVSNHSGYYITKSSWPVLKEHWKRAFRDSAYLRVDGKPLIIFFDYQSFITDFGSAQAVKDTFATFRNEVAAMGLNGVTIAGCAWPEANAISKALSCGFDLLTGYNFRSLGQTGLTTPIENMYTTEYNTIYNAFKNAGARSIPISTLNFDQRPWSAAPEQEKIFTGFSYQSVFNSVYNLRKWIKENPSSVTKEKLGLLYAWNEYGEGGWLTPSIPLKDSLLQGLKGALRK